MSITSVKTGTTGLSLALDNNYMEPIATTVVGSGGVNQITFNDIPQGYKHLQIRGISRNTGGSVSYSIYLSFNGTSSGYSWHWVKGDGDTASTSGIASEVNVEVKHAEAGGTSTAPVRQQFTADGITTSFTITGGYEANGVDRKSTRLNSSH